MFNDQHILILGLGASGLAMARWCARGGARVTVADTRDAPPQLGALREQLPQAGFVAGEFTEALLDGVSAVYRSPGLTPAQVAIVFDAARARGLPTGSELDLFAQALAHLQARRAYRPSVLAITGTNGKTTVTSLTGQLIERSGRSVAVAGNIGPSMLDTLAASLDANAKANANVSAEGEGEAETETESAPLPQVWVLELSSFQLHEAKGFEPTAAAVLNLTQDHLDW
ncbi:MAG TPA: Mur ligase family protein, partial [Ramlibacter sp.]|nr:Mur ligase family protein [Ramlibacter sp.]